VQPVAGVAGRRGIGFLYLEKFLLRKDPQLRSRVLGILDHQNVDLEWERWGIDSLALLLSGKQLAGKGELLRGMIADELKPDRLEIFENMAAIALVGEGISMRPDVTAAVLQRLSEQNIHPRLMEQGASKISALFLVHADEFDRAAQAIHDAID
jgi:aspartate kinase